MTEISYGNHSPFSSALRRGARNTASASTLHQSAVMHRLWITGEVAPEGLQGQRPSAAAQRGAERPEKNFPVRNRRPLPPTRQASATLGRTTVKRAGRADGPARYRQNGKRVSFA